MFEKEIFGGKINSGFPYSHFLDSDSNIYPAF